MAPLARARKGGDLALRRYYADAMVPVISHNDVALPVHCHTAGLIELSGGSFSVAMAIQPSARQRGHHALR
eukprot:6669699-Pyramimonas_sp.AAC.1